MRRRKLNAETTAEEKMAFNAEMARKMQTREAEAHLRNAIYAHGVLAQSYLSARMSDSPRAAVLHKQVIEAEKALSAAKEKVQELHGGPVELLPPVTDQKKPARKKGVCKKCGAHIGRGVHFHEKGCKGVNTSNTQG